jgi:hypothetical protein
VEIFRRTPGCRHLRLQIRPRGSFEKASTVTICLQTSPTSNSGIIVAVFVFSIVPGCGPPILRSQKAKGRCAGLARKDRSPGWGAEHLADLRLSATTSAFLAYVLICLFLGCWPRSLQDLLVAGRGRRSCHQHERHRGCAGSADRRRSIGANLARHAPFVIDRTVRCRLADAAPLRSSAVLPPWRALMAAARRRFRSRSDVQQAPILGCWLTVEVVSGTMELIRSSPLQDDTPAVVACRSPSSRCV